MSDEEQKIREHAYYLWLAEGRPEGAHHEHWERAREMVRAKPASQTEAPVPAEKPRDPAAAERRGRAGAPAVSSAGAARMPDSATMEAPAPEPRPAQSAAPARGRGGRNGAPAAGKDAAGGRAPAPPAPEKPPRSRRPTARP